MVSKRLYKGDEVSPLLHPIDAKAWMNLGWKTEKPKPEVKVVAKEQPHKEQLAPIVVALQLINAAANASELVVLPGIGQQSAEVIFESRPTGGYESLKAVSEVDRLSPRINWVAVEQYSAEG